MPSHRHRFAAQKPCHGGEAGYSGSGASSTPSSTTTALTSILHRTHLISLDEDFVRQGVSIDALSDMAPNFEERARCFRQALSLVPKGCAKCPKCYKNTKSCCSRYRRDGKSAAEISHPLPELPLLVLLLLLLLLRMLRFRCGCSWCCCCRCTTVAVAGER